MKFSEISNNGIPQFFNPVNPKENMGKVQKEIQNFRCKTAREMSELTSRDDCFVPNTEVTLLKEQRGKNWLKRTYSDGTYEIITSEKTSLSGRHYTEKALFDKNNNCYSSIIEGENGVFKSTALDKKARIFEAECSVKKHPDIKLASITYKEDRNKIEIQEAKVKRLDGTSYKVEKEKDQYGFDTGHYLVTEMNKAGKTKSIKKIYPFEMQPEPRTENLENSSWFSVDDFIFLTRVGMEELIL